MPTVAVMTDSGSMEKCMEKDLFYTLTAISKIRKIFCCFLLMLSIYFSFIYSFSALYDIIDL